MECGVWSVDTEYKVWKDEEQIKIKEGKPYRVLLARM